MGSEYLFPLLLAANPQYRLVLIFTNEIEIVIPEVELEDEYEQRPAWLEEDLEGNAEEEVEIEFASEEDS